MCERERERGENSPRPSYTNRSTICRTDIDDATSPSSIDAEDKAVMTMLAAMRAPNGKQRTRRKGAVIMRRRRALLLFASSSAHETRELEKRKCVSVWV